MTVSQNALPSRPAPSSIWSGSSPPLRACTTNERKCSTKLAWALLIRAPCSLFWLVSRLDASRVCAPASFAGASSSTDARVVVRSLAVPGLFSWSFAFALSSQNCTTIHVSIAASTSRSRHCRLCFNSHTVLLTMHVSFPLIVSFLWFRTNQLLPAPANGRTALRPFR